MATGNLRATPARSGHRPCLSPPLFYPGLAFINPGQPHMPSRSLPSRTVKRRLSQVLSAAEPAKGTDVERLRVVPLGAGISGLSFVLLNRFLSGVILFARLSCLSRTHTQLTSTAWLLGEIGSTCG